MTFRAPATPSLTPIYLHVNLRREISKRSREHLCFLKLLTPEFLEFLPETRQRYGPQDDDAHSLFGFLIRHTFLAFLATCSRGFIHQKFSVSLRGLLTFSQVQLTTVLIRAWSWLLGNLRPEGAERGGAVFTVYSANAQLFSANFTLCRDDGPEAGTLKISLEIF